MPSSSSSDSEAPQAGSSSSSKSSSSTGQVSSDDDEAPSPAPRPPVARPAAGGPVTQAVAPGAVTSAAAAAPGGSCLPAAAGTTEARVAAAAPEKRRRLADFAERPPGERPKPAKKRAEKPAKPDKRPKVKRKTARQEPPDDDGAIDNAEAEFVLSIDALQGRWRHSSANLGMFVVRGQVLKLDSGISFPIVEHPDGRLEVSGWVASPPRSSADEIVWIKGEFMCKWFLEDDLDRPDDNSGINSNNIVSGKRARQNVDYQTLERQIQEEEARAANSDESSDDNDAKGASLSARDWAKLHAQRVDEALQLFQAWILQTRTPQHEELLRRRGSLKTTLSVHFTGAGQKLIQEELKLFTTKVVHREQGTVVCVDSAGRERWRQRNLRLWETAPLPTARRGETGGNATSSSKPSRAKATSSAPVSAGGAAQASTAAPAASAAAPAVMVGRPEPDTSAAAAAHSSKSVASQPKRRRLRRAVVGSDESDDKASARAAALAQAEEVQLAQAQAASLAHAEEAQLEQAKAASLETANSESPGLQATPLLAGEEQLGEQEDSNRCDQVPDAQQVVVATKAEPSPRSVESTAAASAAGSSVAAAASSSSNSLPPEPPKGEPGRVEVLVRLPDGRRLRRAFRPQSTVGEIYCFAECEAALGGGYQLVTAMPRRVYGDRGATLSQVGLEVNCALILEATDGDLPAAERPATTARPPAESSPITQEPVHTTTVTEAPEAAAPIRNEPALAALASLTEADPGTEQPALSDPPARLPDEAEAEVGVSTSETPGTGAEGEVAASLEEAQAKLESFPPAAEAAALLAFLARQPMDAETLTRTKIGATVNKAKKTYKSDKVVSARAAELVNAWRRIWQDEAKRGQQQQREPIQA